MSFAATTAPTTPAQALAQSRDLGLESLDVQLLLLHAMGRESDARAWLLAHAEDELPLPARAAFLALRSRRLAGEPLAYLVGQKEFFGLNLSVDRRVLIPRPDTETLVEWALEVLRDRPGATVLDLGTGSGAIALALKHQRRDLNLVALDASQDALALAQQNAAKFNLQVAFIRGRWLQAVSGRFDLILSNPPYVRAADPHLAELAWEPLQALSAGPDGLQDLREIVATAPACLRPGSWLLLEHGHDQAAQVRAMLDSAGFQRVTSRRDLAGLERCSGGCQPKT